MSARIAVVALGLWLFVRCAATCATEPPTVVIPRRVTKDLYAWYEHHFSWWDVPAYLDELAERGGVTLNGVRVCLVRSASVRVISERDAGPPGMPTQDGCDVSLIPLLRLLPRWKPLSKPVVDRAIAELVSSGATCLPYREPVCVRLSD